MAPPPSKAAGRRFLVRPREMAVALLGPLRAQRCSSHPATSFTRTAWFSRGTSTGANNSGTATMVNTTILPRTPQAGRSVRLVLAK
eukprot:COSAG02_NODE_50_length_44860_cov_203.992739_35_plen_86_part_00